MNVISKLINRIRYNRAIKAAFEEYLNYALIDDSLIDRMTKPVKHIDVYCFDRPANILVRVIRPLKVRKSIDGILAV